MSSSPFRCPVCEGKRTVPPGFYVAGSPAEPCRTCRGEGIVWGVDGGPMRIVGDLLIEGNVVAKSVQQWVEARDIDVAG